MATMAEQFRSLATDEEREAFIRANAVSMTVTDVDRTIDSMERGL